MDPTITHDGGQGGGRVFDGTATPQLDGFEFIKPIGRGGMGVVWLATQLATKRKVAVKLLAGHQVDADGAGRFRREIELASQLEHPGIARVYDSGLNRGQYYYCMEYVDGLPLNRYAEANNLSRRERIALMRKVCEAVQFAHLNGVIHRDLKPSNILVTTDGQPHVLDFGLAKLLNPSTPSENVSLEGDVVGTPIFMSPEQASGKVQVDTRTDVYSLGVMLFELMTGLFPHDVSGTNHDILTRVIHGDVQNPRSIDRSIDRDLETIILAALSRERDRRYASADALGHDLTNYLHGEPISARAPTTTYILRKKIRKYWIRSVAALLVVAAVVAVGFYHLHRMRAEQARTKAALERAEGNVRILKKVWSVVTSFFRSTTPAISSMAKRHSQKGELLAIIDEWVRLEPEVGDIRYQLGVHSYIEAVAAVNASDV